MNMKKYFERLPDGTVKMVNPFTGEVVWCPPGRAAKPIHSVAREGRRKITSRKVENYCDFCFARYVGTPPEKSRLVLSKDDKTVFSRHLAPREVFHSRADFRRIANLFEIVSYDYWRANTGYRMPRELRDWQNAYIASPGGRKHVLKVMDLKLGLMGRSRDEVKNIPAAEKLRLAEALFGGCHEVIVAGRHYREGARWDDELCSSGELLPIEHYHYFDFTIRALKDIYHSNRKAEYISVFQNWLGAGGASIEHLHKQLVALDEWGPGVKREAKLSRADKDYYSKLGLGLALEHGLVCAANDEAIAFVELGTIYPTVSVVSKGRANRAEEHSPAAVEGMSDLVHACHAVFGAGVPSNEEWCFAPRNCRARMPWRVTLKLRLGAIAGFEGVTGIHVEPLGPYSLRDGIVSRLFWLREGRKIAVCEIGPECNVKPNALKYSKS